jgi:Domain of unknown function (DUF4352)
LGVALIVVLALTFWPHPGPPARVSVAPEVRVTYSSSYTNTVGGLQPSSGSTFLVVHLTMENRGYQNFTANPFRDMFVAVNGNAHNVSAAYAFLSNPFPPSNLKNTESASGDVVFEVPQGSTSFTPQWRLPSVQEFRLAWLPG